MLGFLQSIGRALMLPIAVLPAAGILLRLGQPDLLNIAFMSSAGGAIFDNLALIFAIGVAIGLSNDGHGSAALAGTVGYFVLTKATAAIDKEINMAVLGGIISGIVAAFIYNRFKETKLPSWLGFFSGKRIVPILTAVAMLVLAGVFGYVWPVIQHGIDSVGNWIVGAGALGAGVFGLLNRLLIPLGLHHVLNSLVWFVFGEFGGKTGDLNRFFAGDPSAGVFMSGFFPVMMFGLPAACLAMILAAKKHRRKEVSGLLLGLALTSCLTGITEPIEFTFMFIAPVLYVVHAVLTGVAMAVADLLGIHHGFTFSAGAIDFFLNLGIATKPWLLLVIGLAYGVIYFVVFYFSITKFNLKTPGREDEDTQQENPLVSMDSSSKYSSLAAQYLVALGGKENISTLDNCVTRLRLKVNDISMLDETTLKKYGAKGVIKLNNTDIQVIVGTDVEFLATEMKKIV